MTGQYSPVWLADPGNGYLLSHKAVIMESICRVNRDKLMYTQKL